MNFGIIVSNDGKGEMSWQPPTDISTNVWWSISLQKGRLFNNVGFGLDLSDIKKITGSSITMIRQRIEAALKWLLTTGRAKSIEVLVERDDRDYNRLNWKVTILQADGIPVIVESYRTIGGPASGFTI
ncbi:MAG TPA: phage GP46 family protein [Candidatus Glassbacteria bacterium]|nr:phage GP46 family protein [Candidatus Glassbacteria bacterium]